MNAGQDHTRLGDLVPPTMVPTICLCCPDSRTNSLGRAPTSPSTASTDGFAYTLTRTLGAPVAEAWSACTDAAQYDRWAGAEDVVPNVRPGGDRVPLTGVYTEVVEHERLVMGMHVPGRAEPVLMTAEFTPSATAPRSACPSSSTPPPTATRQKSAPDRDRSSGSPRHKGLPRTNRRGRPSRAGMVFGTRSKGVRAVGWRWRTGPPLQSQGRLRRRFAMDFVHP
ncbi:SRPBCC family protein [Actinomadura napierensis]|uniref:Activator of Hsp90 ATPase homologue 1/2-like C-terminal domain-containing protein n=1 Tax=Actinomadura napierensis TaxID=267854 RepID=A0ABN3A0E7_9ACTN